MGEEVGVVLVFAGLGDSDLLVVCGGFIDDVVKVVGAFDLVEDLLAFGGDGCEFCHGGRCVGNAKGKRGK